MRALFDLFFDICLLRRGPQDVPASTVLLKLCLLAHLFIAYITLLAGTGNDYLLNSFILILLDMGLTCGVCFAVLHLTQQAERLPQTLTTLWGCGILLNLIGLPIVLWIERASRAQTNFEVPLLLLVLLVIWSLTITAHILRHAFSISMSQGFIYAFAFFLLTRSLSAWLLPLPSTGAA